MIEVIEGEGHWCKGTLYKDEAGNSIKDGHSIQRMSACLEGALGLATQDEDQAHRVRSGVLHNIRKSTGVAYTGMPSYNDDDATQQEDVILILKETRNMFEAPVSGV